MTALPDAALSADKRAVLLDANTKGSPLERVQKRSALPLPLSCKPKFVPKKLHIVAHSSPPAAADRATLGFHDAVLRVF